MKLTKLIIIAAASAVAHAQQATTTSAISENNAYLDVSGVYNEFSGNVDAEGFRVNGGFAFGNGLSLDGRFENAYLDLTGFGPSEPGGPGEPAAATEVKFNELRALVHYTHQVNDGAALIGGLGYGKLGFNYGGSELISTEGLLADIGVQIQSDRVSASLTYTHLFAFHTASFAFGGGQQLQDEDLGFLEGSLGYQVNDNVSAILSVQTQVLGDTEIEKELSVALGLRYNF